MKNAEFAILKIAKFKYPEKLIEVIISYFFRDCNRYIEIFHCKNRTKLMLFGGGLRVICIKCE